METSTISDANNLAPPLFGVPRPPFLNAAQNQPPTTIKAPLRTMMTLLSCYYIGLLFVPDVLLLTLVDSEPQEIRSAVVAVGVEVVLRLVDLTQIQVSN